MRDGGDSDLDINHHRSFGAQSSKKESDISREKRNYKCSRGFWSSGTQIIISSIPSSLFFQTAIFRLSLVSRKNTWSETKIFC